MVYLIIGNTGAGKTTYSEILRRNVNGVVFSIDHWNKLLFFDDKKETDGLDWFLERIRRNDLMIQSLVLQLEDASTPSILDLGFAKLNRREFFYAFAKKHKISYQIHYLDIDKEIRSRRVTRRNKEKGLTYQFEVSQADFEFMETWFEPLTNEEKRQAKIITK